MYAKFLRPLLFRFDPELVHDITIKLLRIVGSFSPAYYLLNKYNNAHSHYPSTTKSKIDILGLEFQNRVGLAAGYDRE